MRREEDSPRRDNSDHDCLELPGLGGTEPVPTPGERGGVELLEALGGKLVGPVVAYLVLLSASAVRDELGGGMTLALAKAERRGGRPLAQGLAEGLPEVAV